jgi:hypothetical protein
MSRQLACLHQYTHRRYRPGVLPAHATLAATAAATLWCLACAWLAAGAGGRLLPLRQAEYYSYDMQAGQGPGTNWPSVHQGYLRVTAIWPTQF